MGCLELLKMPPSGHGREIKSYGAKLRSLIQEERSKHGHGLFNVWFYLVKPIKVNSKQLNC